MKEVTVITPSVNSEKLMDAIDSVVSQTYGKVKHLIVFDGVPVSEFRKREILKKSFESNIEIVELPFSTGKVGEQRFYGHRIYAGFSQLVNSDYVCFLDEDNWYTNDHVESLVDVLEKDSDLHFSYSFRGIYSPQKEFLVNDRCESLGKWPIWVSSPDNLQYLIDTSSYCFRKNFLAETGQLWNSGWGGDRRYLALVTQLGAKYEGTGKYTLCYRLDGNPNSVTEEFFREGNKHKMNVYSMKGYTQYPWGEQFNNEEKK